MLGPDLLRVGSDARERRLQVVADAAQELVLRLVQLDQPLPLALDLVEQLLVPNRDGDLAGVELEQVLVRCVPAAGRREVADEDPDALVGQGEDGPDRAQLAGDVLLDGHHRRVNELDAGVDHAERRARAPRRLRDESLQPITGRCLADREEDSAQLRVASLQRRREPVVALHEACQLVLARDLHADREVARRGALDRA